MHEVYDSDDKVDHEKTLTVPEFTGLHLLDDFISEEDEQVLAGLIEADPNWKES